MPLVIPVISLAQGVECNRQWKLISSSPQTFSWGILLESLKDNICNLDAFCTSLALCFQVAEMSGQRKCPDCGSLEVVEDSHYAQSQLVCAECGFILTEGLLTTTFTDEHSQGEFKIPW